MTANLWYAIISKWKLIGDLFSFLVMFIISGILLKFTYIINDNSFCENLINEALSFN